MSLIRGGGLQHGKHTRAFVAVLAAVVLAFTGLVVVPATAYADTPFGTVKAWGNNSYGQLGNNSTTDSSTPVTVSGLTDVQAISGGKSSAYALLSDGTVKAWGRNDKGQLGNGQTEDSSTPVDVVDPDTGNALSGVKAIAAGNGSAYALLMDGTVKAWGWNAYGRLGDGTTDNSLTPVTVSGLSGVKAIAASGNGSAYALLDDGSVKAWGNNDSGQLGDGTTDNRSTPVYVVDDSNVNLSGVQKIAAGTGLAYALINDGTVRAWGRNNNGQLGDWSTRNSSTPVTVSGLADDVEDIAAGWASGYALLANGTVQAWGDNASGQLGNGTGGNGTHDYDSYTPVTVSSLTDGNVVVSAIAVDDVSGYALLSDSTVKAWGGNNNGQLGDGTANNNRTTPVPVSGLTTAVQAIDAGYGSAYAIVAPTDTTTTLTVDLSSVTEGDSVTFTATVSPAVAGSVEFFNGTDSLGTAATDADTGVATLGIDTLPVGTNSVTAVFTPTDPSAFSPSTSNEVTVTVAAEETEPPSTPDNGDTSESDSDTSESDGETSETDSDTALPETGESDNPVEILSLISASLLAAGTALSIGRRRSVQ